jgi:aryl-alcohol dehydrogenase-like predicted oxidoreductase
MRKVQLDGFALPVGAIGFGCASLGSRVSARQGLRALEEAHAAGVNWFDVAPAYGAGDAETILGEFARSKRQDIMICTKVGLAPPQRNTLLKPLYAAARPLVGALGGLRKAFRRMPSTRNVSIPLTPQLVRESLERSLRRLGTEQVDVFALHKPALADIIRDDILRTLQDLRRAGKIGHAGVAGDLQSAQQALQHPEVYTMLQVADDPLTQPLRQLRAAVAAQPMAMVSHSILGVAGTRELLLQVLKARGPAAREQLAQLGYGCDAGQAVADMLVDRALAANAQGVVLLSMFDKQHRDANLRRAAMPLRPETLDRVAELLAAAPA